MTKDQAEQTDVNKAKKRILILVPNGASTDNRVVREAESLKAAGYECLLVGLRLNNLPGRRALTAGGVNVRRVDWQYKAFSKIAAIYAVTFLPIFLLLAAVMLVGISWAYFNLFLPLTGTLFDALSQIFHQLFKLAFSSIQSAGPYTAEALKADNPVLYHIMGIVLFFLVYMLLRRVFRRLSLTTQSIGKGLMAVPFLNSILQKARFARNYGEKENVKSFTFLETILSGNFSPIRWFHEAVVTKVVAHQREKGFIEVGLEFVPDIIQCHEVAALPAAIFLKDKFSCKVIYEAHEIYDDLANASAALSKHHQKVHNLCIPKIDAFVTVNPMLGEYYQETYPHIPTPVIIPNSVYPKTVEYDGRLHEAAKLPEDAKIVLYQGGFAPHRGMEVLVEAAFSLPEDWYVVFMGKGAIEEELREAAEGFENETIQRVSARLVSQFKLDTNEITRLKSALPSINGTEANSATSPNSVHLEEFMNMKSLEAIGSDTESMLALESNIRRLRNLEKKLAAEQAISQEVAEIRDSGIFRKVRFVPMAPHSELVEWTSGGTIGVIPYQNVGLNHWNCSPNKIWEYPNAGLPILCSRLNYLSYMIKTWGIGWTISSDPTPMDIVGAVRAITDEDLDAKRQACKEFIKRDNYTIHEADLLNMVKSLV